MAEINAGELAGVVSSTLTFDRFPDYDEFKTVSWASEDTIQRVV